MRAAGYAGEDFPIWWYSPARQIESSDKSEEVPSSQTKIDEVPSSVVRPVYVPTPPRNPTPIGGKQRRPDLRDETGHSLSELEETPPSSTRRVQTSSSITEKEVAILKARQVTEIVPGQWMHTQEQADGKIVLTPVDPWVELQMLQRENKGDAIVEALGANMIQMLNINTRAIMKKVALNPSVFMCYQFVVNQRDSDTGLPLFSGDFGDYVSHCVIANTETEFGVVPTYLVNRPSKYTTYREMKNRVRENRYEEEYGSRANQVPLSQINFTYPEEEKKE